MSPILTVLLLAGGQQAAAQPPPDVLESLFSPAIVHVLQTIPGHCEYAAKEFFSPYPVVPRGLLPNSLVKDCEDAMVPVLKKQFIPTDLDSRWFGIRENCPLGDILVASYQVSHYDLTWIDSQFELKLYVRDTSTSQRPTDLVGINELVMQNAEEFLRLPPGWKAKYKFNTASKKTEHELVWYGSAHDSTLDPKGPFRYKPEWSDNCNFFADGLTISLEMPSGRGGGQASPNSNDHVSRIGSGAVN